MPTKCKSGAKGMPMEGILARWYARNTGKVIDQYRKAAEDVAAELPSGSHVLEVAPGPGYFAIELAKLGSFHIIGLDISQSFVNRGEECDKCGRRCRVSAGQRVLDAI